MKLPTYDEIARDQNQLDVFETPTDRSLFVAGPPGSGKTTLAIHRAQIVARLGSRVALITYNRMLRRLVALATDGQIEAQTMHKFVWDTYQRLVNAPPPQIEPYVQNWSAMRMEFHQKRIEPQPMHVIVDEGQDLPNEFYRFLRDFVAEGITVFADEDQTIDNSGSSLNEIKVAGRFDDPILLRTNHRNTPEIDQVARFYHDGRVPALDVARAPSGEVPQVMFYDKWAADRIAAWYRNRGGNVGVVVARNDFGETLFRHLRQQLNDTRVDFYRSGKNNEDAIELFEPGMTILNIKSAKGQEFDTVFLLETEDLLREFSLASRRAMYMLCSRARDHLFLLYRGSRVPDGVDERLPGTDILKRP